MKHRAMKRPIVGLLVVCMFGIALAEGPVQETTLGDQADVAVTAYNNGLALVRDVRELALPEGEIELRFSDVAALIRPQTVGLRSLTAAGSVGILEQNYEFDLISPSKLMEKYVGKEVRLVNFSEKMGFDVAIAELLSINEGPVYRIGGEVFLGHPGNVAVPEIPENLIAKPSLIWLVQNEARDQTLEVTYLTDGVSWSADYVITLARDDKSLDVAGWVTMNNQSGATYTNARLKLVAGDVNVVQEEMLFDLDEEAGLALNGVYAFGAAQQEAFAEYHLYTMPRRTTIKQNQSKQLALLSGAGVKCGKKYEFRGQLHFYSQQMPPLENQHAEVFLEFENEEANALGMPLPAGVMRVYQEDSEGMLQFAGEDRIDHTPKDETVRLKMGNAFDVIGERVQMDYRKLSARVHESVFVMTLRNHKEDAIVVDIVEPMPGDWQILDASHEHTKKDARTAVFSVPLKADEEVNVTYRVRVKT